MAVTGAAGGTRLRWWCPRTRHRERDRPRVMQSSERDQRAHRHRRAHSDVDHPRRRRREGRPPHEGRRPVHVGSVRGCRPPPHPSLARCCPRRNRPEGHTRSSVRAMRSPAAPVTLPVRNLCDGRIHDHHDHRLDDPHPGRGAPANCGPATPAARVDGYRIRRLLHRQRRRELTAQERGVGSHVDRELHRQRQQERARRDRRASRFSPRSRS